MQPAPDGLGAKPDALLFPKQHGQKSTRPTCPEKPEVPRCPLQQPPDHNDQPMRNGHRLRFTSQGTVQAALGIVSLHRPHQVGTCQSRRADLTIRPALGQQHQHQRSSGRPRRPINCQTGLAFFLRKLKIAIHGLAPEDCGRLTPTNLTPSLLFSPDHSSTALCCTRGVI